MEHKFLDKNISGSGFDSFELDDGFFMKVESDLEKNKINEKQFDLPNKYNLQAADKPEYILEKNGKEVENCDLPFFIEDLNESDFFAVSKENPSNFSPKVVNVFKDEIEIKTSYDGFTKCLSPIQGLKVTKTKNLSSSTPVKLTNDSDAKENFMKNIQKVEEKAKLCEFDFLEADLFDDWDVTEADKKNKGTEKSTVTFSQALKLIEEAESARDSDKGYLNCSIDLLTGEPVGADMGNMFEESFDLPKSAEEKYHKESSNDNLIVVEDFKVERKPTASQKLNFESRKIDDKSIIFCEDNNFRNICFSSDDDFDFVTQDLLKKPKQVLKRAKSNISENEDQKTGHVMLLKDCDLNESTDAVVVLKKKTGKCPNLIDSDTTEDSPSPKFHRQSKITKTGKNFLENIGREFIDYEAEVSDKVEVSSDEEEEEGEYDKSFLDENSYFSQNCSNNMTAKYLQSVKSVKRFGSFKIPAMKPYNPHNVFSQIPEENNTDYEIDSFCVNEIEEEIKTDLSDLEVAEKILEMNRKRRKKKRSQKSKKCK